MDCDRTMTPAVRWLLPFALHQTRNGRVVEATRQDRAVPAVTGVGVVVVVVCRVTVFATVGAAGLAIVRVKPRRVWISI